MNELTVILPAYNEAANIEILVDRWQVFSEPLLRKYGLYLQIVIVNDGSTDRTRAISEKLQQQHANITLINHEKNSGLGEAVKTGLVHVLKNCPNSVYTCLMDCDNTHDPKYVMDMLEKAGADVIIASRYQKGAHVHGVSGYRLFTSIGAKWVYSIFFNVKDVKDYTCGYRLYSRDILDKAYTRFADKIVEEKDFTCMAELLYKLYLVNARFAEIPFNLRYDFKQGKSKMKLLRTSINSVTLALRLRKLKYLKQKDVQNEYIKI